MKLKHKGGAVADSAKKDKEELKNQSSLKSNSQRDDKSHHKDPINKSSN
jgi:hypothetical protein